MSKTVKIPLAEPLKGRDGPVHEVVVRRPTFADYLEAGGEPYSIGQSEEGALFTIEKQDVLKAYFESLIVEPSMLVLEEADFTVAREVRKAIMGFFQAPAAAAEPSPTSPTTSSSN